MVKSAGETDAAVQGPFKLNYRNNQLSNWHISSFNTKNLNCSVQLTPLTTGVLTENDINGADFDRKINRQQIC